MEQSEFDALVQRLVADPHDEDALAYAHGSGASDPKSYALLLERVGTETQDAAYSSHWLSEAANIWSSTLGDAHRAARVLMQAIDRDPTQRVAAERLAQLYRDKNDIKALVALLERRAKTLAPLATGNAEIKSELSAMYEELGRLWAESLSQPKKAIESFRRSIDLDPQSVYAIYSARELYKSQGQFDEAFPLYEQELAVERDPARQVALLRDEADAHRAARDLPGVTKAIVRARQIDPQDHGLQQEYSASIIERMQAGEAVPEAERTLGAELLVGLAEAYDGEHGVAYAGGALDIEPGLDRALQLFAHYARSLGRDEELSTRYLGYVTTNPNGEQSSEARHILAASYEAAGQLNNAIQMLEPLRALGDPEATAKLRELYPLVGRSAATSQVPTAPAASSNATPIAVVSPASGSTEARGSGVSSLVAAFGSSGENSAARRLSAMAPDKLQGVLDAAQMLANKGKKPDAFSKYKEVLEGDPAHPEALSWVEDYLRTKRDYAQLRDVLLAAVRTMPTTAESTEPRKERLREVAGLCEGNLRDTDGAVNAWKQLLSLDRSDEGARSSLTRLLEKAQRWDDLANLLEQEATAESDLEKKIALEKKLAQMQETKRRDFAAAAEAWGRIANLTPEDDRAIATASKMFEKAQRNEQAAMVISDNAEHVTDPVARGALLERLGELRELLNDVAGAGEAFTLAAEAQHSAKMWEAAERCFVSAERWARAADAADHRAHMSGDAKQQASHFARAAEHFAKGGDEGSQVARLEQATELDPVTEEYASQLTHRYSADSKWEALAGFLSKRGERLTDKAKRIGVRRQAATLYATQLNDKEASRDEWLKVLEDGDDREALERLIDDAVTRADHTEATTLLRRLGNTIVDRAERARVALREAELLAEGVGDVDMAIVRYETILEGLDATCRPALQAIADLQEARENHVAAADALERELKLVADVQERGQIAARLARLYERLDDARNAIRALDLVRKADLEDFDALARLCELCEKIEQWDRVAELLAQRIEVEADEVEISHMTKKLATILADKLDRGDEALAALTELADSGDPDIRAAYLGLGDSLGWKGIVATKLVEWFFEAKHGAERTQSLRGAFERFAEVGRDQDAVRVAVELVRSRGADRALAERLEVLTVKTGDQDALAISHDLLARDLQGIGRATELVRQAEARAKAGTPRVEAIQHGEAGLTSIAPSDAEPLLARLGLIAEKTNDLIDLYERQVSRCRAPADRMRALARAAQVAAQRGQIDRARGFFELALSGAPNDDTMAILEASARDGDEASGGEKLRRALSNAMAAGGQGSRDGGRTRGALLRRAASMAHRDLRDLDQAFSWLGDALIAHVDPLTLDSLEGLGVEIGDLGRVEATLTHALSEVFDGPLVRLLFSRRAKVRRELMGDRTGAAADLKKLHDLSPNDHSVMEELSGLLTELGDYRGMVQLYEDQILRGKDMNARAELARKVARMWEEQLQDPREAADAWRRVLRMKTGDTEATAGLERAKTNMLKKPDPSAGAEAYAPPKMTASVPPPAKASASVPPPAKASIAPAPMTARKEATVPTPTTLPSPNAFAPAAASAPLPVPPSSAPASRPPQPVKSGPLPPPPSASAPAPLAPPSSAQMPSSAPATVPQHTPRVIRKPAPDDSGPDLAQLTAAAEKRVLPFDTITKPERPDIAFRNSSDEITLSAPSTLRKDLREQARPTNPTMDLSAATAATKAADLSSLLDDIEDGEMGKTGEGSSLDFLDATMARPLSMPDATEDLAGLMDDEDVLVADDLAEIVDDENVESVETVEPPPVKRTQPPPFPRG